MKLLQLSIHIGQLMFTCLCATMMGGIHCTSSSCSQNEGTNENSRNIGSNECSNVNPGATNSNNDLSQLRVHQAAWVRACSSLRNIWNLPPVLKIIVTCTVHAVRSYALMFQHTVAYNIVWTCSTVYNGRRKLLTYSLLLGHRYQYNYLLMSSSEGRSNCVDRQNGSPACLHLHIKKPCDDERNLWSHYSDHRYWGPITNGHHQIDDAQTAEIGIVEDEQWNWKSECCISLIRHRYQTATTLK